MLSWRSITAPATQELALPALRRRPGHTPLLKLFTRKAARIRTGSLNHFFGIPIYAVTHARSISVEWSR